MSWRSPASLRASVLHLYKEGVGLVSRGKSFETDFPGSHSLRGGDNWTTDDQSVAPTKRVLSVCRCWVQHSCSNGSFRKAEWPRLGPRVNCEPTPPSHVWAARQRETSLSVSHCPAVEPAGVGCARQRGHNSQGWGTSLTQWAVCGVELRGWTRLDGEQHPQEGPVSTALSDLQDEIT